MECRATDRPWLAKHLIRAIDGAHTLDIVAPQIYTEKDKLSIITSHGQPMMHVEN